MLPCKFCKIFKNPFFVEHLQTTTSVKTISTSISNKTEKGSNVEVSFGPKYVFGFNAKIPLAIGMSTNGYSSMGSSNVHLIRFLFYSAFLLPKIDLSYVTLHLSYQINQSKNKLTNKCLNI